MAATLIENRDGSGQVSRFYIQGQKAHIIMPQQDGYTVMDSKTRSLKVVIHPQRMVIDMSSLLTGTESNVTHPAKTSTIKLTKSNDKPDVAGYKTQGYDLHANNKYCGSVMVSSDASESLKLKEFAQLMQNMSEQINKKIAGFTGYHAEQFLTPCELAHKKLGDQYKDIGVPLRILDAKKSIITEVIRIDKNARLPANAFVIPKDYQVTNPQKMMNEAMHNMNQMQDMMKNIPPEAMEMMQQRLQQMYQQ